VGSATKRDVPLEPLSAEPTLRERERNQINRSRAGILPAQKDQGTGKMPILQVRFPIPYSHLPISPSPHLPTP